MQEDTFLHDHTLGRDIAKLDPAHLSLPIVPLTVSMEIVAQAAVYLFPNLVLTGMRDLRAYHWVLLQQDQVELELEANRTAATASEEAEGTVAVEVTLTVRGRAGARTQPALVGTMLLAHTRPTPPASTPLSLDEAQPSQWTPEKTYRTGMFHGPSFRAITEVTTRGSNGAIATMAAPTPDRFFRSEPHPQFVAEPVLLDAAGQLVGLWTLESLASDFVVFPYRFDKLCFYGPPLLPGETVTCAAKIELHDGARVVSDIELVDQQGALRVKLFAWEDRRFSLPRELYQFILNPSEHTLSQRWYAPLDIGWGTEEERPAATTTGSMVMQPAARYCCRRIGAWGQWNSHFEFWGMVIAYLLLTARERRAWQARTEPGPRRRDWLLGRIAAKEAVIALVREHFGLRLAPADVEIVTDEAGKPMVVGGWLTALGATINLSISHSETMAVALVGLATAESALGVGIDLEPTTREAALYADIAFTKQERALLRTLTSPQTPDTLDDEWALRAWCAKEALGKALGYGLRGGPHSIVVTEIDSSTGIIQLGIRGALRGHVPLLADASFQAHTAQDDGWVVATVLDAVALRHLQAY